MIKIGTFCSGIGSPEQAIKNLGIDHSVEFACEIDKYARITYKSNHKAKIFYNDLTALDFNTLPDVNLFVAGFPCFPKGNLITTNKGLKDISEIKKGDLVLTHNKRFMPVIETMQKFKQGIFNLKIKGIPEFKVTEEHPFYCIERVKKWDNSIRRYIYEYSEPKWVNTQDLNDNHFIALGINTLSENPKNLTEEQCFLLGRYIADGFIRNNKRPNRKNSFNNQVIFGIGKHKLNEFKNEIKTYYVGYVEERTSIKCKIINKELMDLCLTCGKGAKNKVIPNFIMNLPLDLLEKFLKGYLSGDGGIFENTIRAVSISDKLIYQIGQIINKLYRKHYSIIKTLTPDTTIIEGRTVNQNDYWSIQYRNNLQTKYFLDLHGFIWTKFFKKEYDNTFSDIVYNFEVDGDNSYVCNNLVVHNCQAFSIAGKRQGFEDARGTIFFYIHEYLKIKRPEIFILENVKGLLSHDSGNTFDVIIKSLAQSINGTQLMFVDENSINYHVYYKVLNATDCGIPQNRERVFIIGFRDDNHSFKFPEKQVLKLRLKDLLEENVSDKYFVSQKTLDTLLKQSSKNNGFNICIADNKTKTANTLRANYSKIGTTDQLISVIPGESVGQRIYSPDGVSSCLSANGGGQGAKTGLYAIDNLPTQSLEGVTCGYKVRRLTPLEVFRLMGFPDDFIKPVSETQQYKQAGNSIVVNVMEAILKEVLKFS